MHYTFDYERFSSIDELSSARRRSIAAAQEALQSSYAPYSDFRVGAAVELQDGVLLRGANQENAAYPSGLCAERVALFSAMSQHPRRPIVRMAIAAKNSKGWLARPITPCGSCRQVMLEYAQLQREPIEVIMFGTEEIIVVTDARQLLPFAFGL